MGYQRPSQNVIVSVDGIIQPFNAYTVVSANFNEGSGAQNQVIDLGSYVGVDDQAAKVEIRSIQQLVGNDDTVLVSNNSIARCRWTVLIILLHLMPL